MRCGVAGRHITCSYLTSSSSSSSSSSTSKRRASPVASPFRLHSGPYVESGEYRPTKMCCCCFRPLCMVGRGRGFPPFASNEGYGRIRTTAATTDDDHDQLCIVVVIFPGWIRYWRVGWCGQTAANNYAVRRVGSSSMAFALGGRASGGRRMKKSILFYPLAGQQ
jgi:hypothetical protein